jgi:hypothetical protein
MATVMEVGGGRLAALLDGDGRVVNRIRALDDYTPPGGLTLEPCPDHVGVGWKKRGAAWIAPELHAVLDAAGAVVDRVWVHHGQKAPDGLSIAPIPQERVKEIDVGWRKQGPTWLAPAEPDPVEKLRAFLRAHPDVRALVGM